MDKILIAYTCVFPCDRFPYTGTRRVGFCGWFRTIQHCRDMCADPGCWAQLPLSVTIDEIITGF